MLSQKQFDRLFEHYCQYLGGDPEPRILHPRNQNDPDGPHLDVVLFAPTPERPFQVLATIGASEYAMKGHFGSLTNRNEYITFAPADWDFTAPEHRWLLHMLQVVAAYPRQEQAMLTYAHSLDLSVIMEEYPETNMIGAALMFPEVCEPDILRCKTGLFSTATILHMMPITRAEMDEQLRYPDWCTERFYPDDEPDEAMSFLCARNR